MSRKAIRAGALAGLLAILLLVLPAGTGAQGSQPVVEVHLIETGDEQAPYAFEPQVVEVEPGTTVRWINDADVFHTVTSTDSQEERKSNGEYQGSLSAEGDTFEHTFEEAGTFEYFCQPHASFMFGTVEVVGEEAGQEAPLPAGLALLALMGAALIVARR